MFVMTTQDIGNPVVAKKRTPKATLYVEIPQDLKERLDALALRRMRKITAEAILALRRYLDEEDAKDGLLPKPEDK